jgi:drug/metabolite transporter (DMT)-like permease
MATARTPLDAFATALMIVLCMIWGLQQVAVKLAAPFMGPTTQTGLRSLAAALLVCLLIRWRGQPFPGRAGTLWPGLGSALLFALEFLCVSIGLEYTSASHMSVFIYTAPIFTVLGLHWFVAGERLAPLQWAGVLLAFGGIALAFSKALGGVRDQAWTDMLLGDALGVAAGLLWGATTVLIRRSALSEAPPATTLLYQLGGAGVLLLAIAAATGEAAAATMPGIVWASLFFQSVVVAFITFLAWFWMLRRYLASRLAAFSFLTPLFGVGFGVLLLDDPISMQFAAGAVLVLIGIVMVNLRKA